MTFRQARVRALGKSGIDSASGIFHLAVVKTAILALLLAAPVALAVNIPRGSFSPEELDEAKARAAETGRPLAVIITNTGSTCPLCISSTAEAFSRLRSDYVLVIEDAARNDKLPPALATATHPIYTTKGNFIPIIAVVEPEDYRLLGGMCHNQIAEDSRRAFRTLATEVREAREAAPASTPSEESTPAGLPDLPEAGIAGIAACETSGMREWTNAQGRTIVAELVKVEDGKVSFKLENGRHVEYAFVMLSEESQSVLENAFPDQCR